MPENNTPVENQTENNPAPQPVQAPPVQPTPDSAAANEKADAETNKAMAVLAYFIFFLPLIAAKDSKFARYHANQGLILLLAGAALYILQYIVMVISWGLYFRISFIFMLVGLAIAVLGVLGIVNAVKGEKKPMPLIGNLFTIIK